MCPRPDFTASEAESSRSQLLHQGEKYQGNQNALTSDKCIYFALFEADLAHSGMPKLEAYQERSMAVKLRCNAKSAEKLDFRARIAYILLHLLFNVSSSLFNHEDFDELQICLD